MSDLAASGGYYVAIAAPQIVAQPATLTGSIGIYGGKFVTGGTFEKLGANIESVIIGRNAGIESPERPFTESERQKLREQIRDFYDGFVQKVATSRKMPVEQVDQVAQGRVWTGAQAREKGLVDALGGLDRAIALAKDGAGISPETEVEVVTYPARKSLAELLMEQLSGSNNDRQVEAVLSVVSGLRDCRAPDPWHPHSSREAFPPRGTARIDADEFSEFLRRRPTGLTQSARLSASGSMSIFIFVRAFSM